MLNRSGRAVRLALRPNRPARPAHPSSAASTRWGPGAPPLPAISSQREGGGAFRDLQRSAALGPTAGAAVRLGGSGPPRAERRQVRHAGRPAGVRR